MAYIDPIEFVSQSCEASSQYVANVLKLLDKGATIPFIARYRKEMTGNMDEVRITQIVDSYKNYKELESRKKTIIDSIHQQDKLTDTLLNELTACRTLRKLEDLYLPYKPKRQTRAMKARAKGLEPLATLLLKQQNADVESLALPFVRGEVAHCDEALQGARDIIAEWINENELARNRARQIADRELFIVSKVMKGKEQEGEKYSDYFEMKESIKRIPSHRLLAMKRGENEGILRVSIQTDDEKIIGGLEQIFVKGKTETAKQVSLSVYDSYKRLLFPALETEQLSTAKEKADKEAIVVFSENLRQLLLTAPLGNKRIMAIDPGYRTGCKVVCLDETGHLLHNETIYPHAPQKQTKQAASKICQLAEIYKIEAIAIGNGTAGRETEHFIKNIHFKNDVQAFIVNESGASIYSASKIARDEFPQYDITVRGAVSIGRRLMDPLAELVKIDPKSIGVGQYQHDVDQNNLKEALERVVVSCVNRVGVNVNSSGKHLLSYVSGLGPALAENIVEYIKENGALRNRKELLKIKRMGPKSYEQCAGFLRIENGDNPLDNSAVHPESYDVVERIAKDMHVNVTDLIGNEKLCDSIDIQRYIDRNHGEITIRDIIDEIRKPGRDPRSVAKVFEFDSNIKCFEDVKEGMIVPGIVSNLTNFGAFVDIGVKQDGLVHVSEIADRFISNPIEVLSLNQYVTVKVIHVDTVRKRIGLSIKQANS